MRGDDSHEQAAVGIDGGILCLQKIIWLASPDNKAR
jgi:hypothetical protein